MVIRAAECPFRNTHDLLIDLITNQEISLLIRKLTWNNARNNDLIYLVNGWICCIENQWYSKQISTKSTLKKSELLKSILLPQRLKDKVDINDKTKSCRCEDNKDGCWVEGIQFVGTAAEKVENRLHRLQFSWDILVLTVQNVLQSQIN